MKSIILLSIFLIIVTISNAQDIVVADAVDKSPIPFVTVKFNESGLYTNEKGILRTDLTKTKSLELYHLGYKTLKIYTVDIQDTIYMQPEATVLNEVVIDMKGHNTTLLKPLKSGKGFSISYLLLSMENSIVIHPKKEITGFYVDEVTIPFHKRNKWLTKDYLKKTKAFVRINIYQVDNNLPSTQIYSSNPIEIHAQDKDEITLDLSRHLIQLSQKGLSFGIEFLGFYDDNDNLIEFDDDTPSYVLTTLTGKTSNSYDATTYIKYIFNKETNFILMNDFINRDDGFLKKEYHRNLSIGLKLSNPNPGK